MSSNVIKEFKAQSIFRLEENLPRVVKCFALLSEEEVWIAPNPSSNSMANLILHLCGNIRQYIISSLGDAPDVRNRDQEFSTRQGYNKVELLKKLSGTIEESIQVIEDSTEENMMKSRMVQGFELTGLGIVLHVVEHYTYHVGQIAYYTKYLKNSDLGFYADLDLNVKND